MVLLRLSFAYFDVSFSDVFILCMGKTTFWERAAHSVDRIVCSLCIISIVILVIYHCFVSVLIEPVPGYCLLLPFLLI